ncbi:MAG: LPS export ABC transporter periplasmic protein LptC [Candidatus Omnitrophica bacterium]|nr:LPS export ABC transporter periplasmic protein LptC [Candidatus Omnitrophota bacterium]
MKIKLIILNILYLFFLVSVGFAQEQNQEIIPAPKAGQLQPQQQLQGFNLQGYSNTGEKQWDLKGEKADIVGNEIKLKNVDANTYGQNKVNVTADTGYIDQTQNKMRLEKDVVITAQDGQQMMTNSLEWDRNKETVKTKDDVMFTGNEMTVTGKGLEASTKDKTAQIKEDVTARVNTTPNAADKNIVTITSDGPMELDQAQMVAVFHENVVAVRDTQTLKADIMKVYFSQEQKKITKLVCQGNVTVTQGENQSFAEEAVYDAATQKVTLSGRPKLIFKTEGNNGFTPFGN